MRSAVLVGVLLAARLSVFAQSSKAPPPAQAPVAPSANLAYDPQIVSALLDLLGPQTNVHPSQNDFTATSLADLLRVGTPEGFALRVRYLNLGTPLSQSLAITEDKRLADQLVENSRWERTPEIRAVALIAMAAKQDPASKKFFEEALNNPKPEIRFTALEAIQVWGLPEGKYLYIHAIRSDPAPFIRVYAAQALFRSYGDALGLETLRKEVGSGDWLVSALASKYLGDLGTGEDYNLVLDRMLMEVGKPPSQSNEFVKAEAAIAALKLFPKKGS